MFILDFASLQLFAAHSRHFHRPDARCMHACMHGNMRTRCGTLMHLMHGNMRMRCIERGGEGDRLLRGVQRLLFAFLFLSSGAQKLSTFNLSNGGPTMEFMAPKMDVAVQHIEKLIGQSLNVPKAPLTCTACSRSRSRGC